MKTISRAEAKRRYNLGDVVFAFHKDTYAGGANPGAFLNPQPFARWVRSCKRGIRLLGEEPQIRFTVG